MLPYNVATNVVLRSFTSHITKHKGVCKLMVHVERLSCRDKFFVTQTQMQDVSIILGRTWQKRYNCFFNWKNNLVHCQSGNEKLWIPLHIADTHTHKLDQELIASKPDIASTFKVKPPQLQSWIEKDPSTNLTLKWVPKNKQKKTNHTLIWVPKDISSKSQSSQAIKIHKNGCLRKPQ